jgi:hypothetical protein
VKNSKLKFGNVEDYKDSIRGSYRRLVLIGIVLFLIGYLASQSFIAIIFPISVIGFEWFEAQSWYKIYITEILFYEKVVIVKYLVNEVENEVTCERSMAKAEIKRVWYKLNSNPTFLRLQLDRIIIDQHQLGKWDKATFQEVKSYFSAS